MNKTVKPLAKRTRDTIMACYLKYGIEQADKQIRTIIQQAEHSKVPVAARSEIKGELAEVALEVYLLEIQKYLKNSILSKGLCIRDTLSGRTTEMDVTLFTPCKIYMFECKSYAGKKILTKECTLKGANTTDVFSQSQHHMEVLNQYLSTFRINRSIKGGAPYKLVLFELSTTDCKDCRDERWKRLVPLVTLDTLWDFLCDEFTTSQKINWDFARMLPIINQLDKESPALFREHMNRMRGKHDIS